MQDYEPLDISRSCNSGPEVLGSEAANVETGLKSFRGLPFMIGGLAGRSWRQLVHCALAEWGQRLRSGRQGGQAGAFRPRAARNEAGRGRSTR